MQCVCEVLCVRVCVSEGRPGGRGGGGGGSNQKDKVQQPGEPGQSDHHYSAKQLICPDA